MNTVLCASQAMQMVILFSKNFACGQQVVFHSLSHAILLNTLSKEIPDEVGEKHFNLATNALFEVL